MACQWEHLLSAYLDGELSSERRQEVERHMRQCAQCEQALQEMGEVSRRVAGAAMARSSEMAKARLRQGLRRRHQEQAVRRLTGWLTAAAVAVVLGVMVISPSEPTASPSYVRVSDSPVVNVAMMRSGEDVPDVVLAAHWMASDLSASRDIEP